MAPSVWFITGASSGIGLMLSLRALAAGHTVIAAVRKTAKASEATHAIQSKGGRVIELDVSKADAIADVAAHAVAMYGHIDVLVNNAGYLLMGAIEDLTEEEIANQFDTNFFGPLRLIRAVLPSMRAQGSGTIVNVSSIAAQDGLPSCGLFAASKFALEGLSESLAREVSPFGISTLIVEPGAFKTNLFAAAHKTPVSEAYQGGPVSVVFDRFGQMSGKQKGDPAKAADRIFQVVTGKGPGGALQGKILRLPLGPDCVARIEAKLESVAADIEISRDVASSTNIDGFDGF